MANPEYSSNYPSVIPVVPPPLPANAYGSTISPYPQISPYDYSYQNDTNVGGIWEHTERTRDRKYYFNVDFLWMSTKPPQGIFGNPNSQTYVRQSATLSIRALRQAAAEAVAAAAVAAVAAVLHRPAIRLNCCRTRASSPKRRPTSRAWPTTTTRSTWERKATSSAKASIHHGLVEPRQFGDQRTLLVRRQRNR